MSRQDIRDLLPGALLVLVMGAIGYLFFGAVQRAVEVKNLPFTVTLYPDGGSPKVWEHVKVRYDARGECSFVTDTGQVVEIFGTHTTVRETP